MARGAMFNARVYESGPARCTGAADAVSFPSWRTAKRYEDWQTPFCKSLFNVFFWPMTSCPAPWLQPHVRSVLDRFVVLGRKHRWLTQEERKIISSYNRSVFIPKDRYRKQTVLVDESAFPRIRVQGNNHYHPQIQGVRPATVPHIPPHRMRCQPASLP